MPAYPNCRHIIAIYYLATKETSHYVLVVYRHAFATAAIASFALVRERKLRPKITFPIFMHIFVLGLLGPVIDQNFYHAGLKFTSPTFSCAMSNMLPAMTFVMAVLCRMEKVEIKKVGCQAKVWGTIVAVGGAMLMTLYKGHVIKFAWSEHHTGRVGHSISTGTRTSNAADDKDWVKGSILLIMATLAWASFFILQVVALKRYSAQLSLTAFVCFMGTLQSIGVTFVMEHSPSAWTIGVTFVIVLGAALIAAGLYSVLWGECKEHKDLQEADLYVPQPTKGTGDINIATINVNDFEAAKDTSHNQVQVTNTCEPNRLPILQLSNV